MQEIRIPLGIPLVQAAMVGGLALIGDGVDGSPGAGIALVGFVAVGFLIALLATKGPESARGGRHRPRWFLLLDGWHRWRSARRRERARRKGAEIAYVHRRRARLDQKGP